MNVTGAEDTLLGSILESLVQGSGGFEDPESLERIVEDGQAAAVLKSERAVSPLPLHCWDATRGYLAWFI